MSLSTRLPLTLGIPALMFASLSGCDALAPATTRSASVAHSVSSDERSLENENNSDDATPKKSKGKASSSQSEDETGTTDDEPTRRPSNNSPINSTATPPSIGKDNPPSFDPPTDNKQTSDTQTTKDPTNPANTPTQTPMNNPVTQSPLTDTATSTNTQTSASPIGPAQTTTSTNSTNTTDQKLCFLVGSQPHRDTVDPLLIQGCSQTISVQVNCAGTVNASSTQVIRLPEPTKTRTAYGHSDEDVFDKAHIDIDNFGEEFVGNENSAENFNQRTAELTTLKNLDLAIARTKYHKCPATNVTITAI